MLDQFKAWIVQQPTSTRLLIIIPLQLALCAGCFLTVALSPDRTPAAPSEADIQTAAVLYLTEFAGSATVTETPVPATATPTSTPTPTETPTETPTPLPTVPGSAAGCVPLDTQREVATLLQIVDGDTISVRIDGQNYNVRYIGMDTPESGQPGGYAATQRNYQLVFGKELLLVKDTSETDRFDRLLRYVIAGDVFVNEQLVRDGLAIAKDYPPDSACRIQLTQAQAQAKADKVGQWAPTPVPAPTAAIAPAPIAPGGGSSSGGDGNCDPAYPTVCIPRYPPDLNCGDIPYRRFQVLAPDPHGFDRDGDGIGCESN